MAKNARVERFANIVGCFFHGIFCIIFIIYLRDFPVKKYTSFPRNVLYGWKCVGMEQNITGPVGDIMPCVRHRTRIILYHVASDVWFYTWWQMAITDFRNYYDTMSHYVDRRDYLIVLFKMWKLVSDPPQNA